MKRLDKHKKVLIINTSMITAFGGAERYADNLVKYLSKFYDVTYIGNLYKSNESFVSKYKKEYSPFKSQRLITLPRIIKRRPIVATLRLVPPLKNTLISKFNFSIDTVISNSSIDDIVLLNNGIKYKKIIIVPHSLDKKFGRLYPNSVIAGHQFKIIAINHTMFEYLSKTYGANNVKLIYPGLSVTKSKSSKPSLERFNISNNSIVLLSIGRLEEKQKNLSCAIRAIAELKNKENIIFIIAGDGKDRDKYLKLVRKLGLEKNVNIVGKISDAEKYDLLKKATFYLQPSVKENLSVSLLEGMRFGVIPIVTVNDSSRDLINDKENGFFVEPAPNNIANVIDSAIKLKKEEILKLSKKAKKAVEDLTLNSMIKKYVKLINSFAY